MPIKLPLKKQASNKTQTLIKKPTPEPAKPSPPSHAQSKLTPFIDKLSIVLEPLDEDAHGIHSNIWSQFSDKSVFQSAGSKAQKGGWKSAQLIALQSTGSRPLLQYRWEGNGPSGKATRLRLDFNPRKVGAQGIIELDAVLTSLLPQGWSYVIEHGRLTRIDIAVNIKGVRMDEVLFIPKQSASVMRWGQDGHLQSLRHGLPKGNQTLIYSVKKKRLGKGQLWIGQSTVRVERRLRNPSPWKLSNLGEVKNPFADMAFTMMPGPPLGGKEWQWSMFVDSVKARGLDSALALLPTARRTQYRFHLMQHPQPWWNPEAIWSNWPSAYQPLAKSIV